MKWVFHQCLHKGIYKSYGEIYRIIRWGDFIKNTMKSASLFSWPHPVVSVIPQGWLRGDDPCRIEVTRPHVIRLGAGFRLPRRRSHESGRARSACAANGAVNQSRHDVKFATAVLLLWGICQGYLCLGAKEIEIKYTKESDPSYSQTQILFIKHKAF